MTGGGFTEGKFDPPGRAWLELTGAEAGSDTWKL